jgi:CoA binding protein
MGLPNVTMDLARRTGRGSKVMSDEIGHILETFKTLAVVGLSSKHMRASYGVASYMQARGYRIIPVNPRETSVLNEKAYATLEEVPESVPVVVIFRRPDCVPDAGRHRTRRSGAACAVRGPDGHSGPLHSEGARQAVCRRRNLISIHLRISP